MSVTIIRAPQHTSETGAGSPAGSSSYTPDSNKMTGLSTNDILLSSGVVVILCTLIRSRAFANRISMVLKEDQ